MPVYKFDKSYSCLISAPPPFNILLLPIVPYFLMSKDVIFRRWVNKQVLKLLHLPVATLSVLTFTFMNLLFLPLAYGKAILHKALIFKRTKSSTALTECLVFSLVGFYVLVIG